ncbi:hypothetical protein [Streptomyces erythrochromogenes]|uniref:hypothetical protein n=1 Tax=Streptomyces erythrochromogenes TaxID=285574 RepID=UPI0037D2BCA9
MTGQTTALFACYGCKERFLACPECVTTIRVDPVTNRPPDAAIIDGKAVHVSPDPEAAARAVQQPVCDGCVSLRNAAYLKGGPEAAHIESLWETTEDRHRRSHA